MRKYWYYQLALSFVLFWNPWMLWHTLPIYWTDSLA